MKNITSIDFSPFPGKPPKHYESLAEQAAARLDRNGLFELIRQHLSNDALDWWAAAKAEATTEISERELERSNVLTKITNSLKPKEMELKRGLSEELTKQEAMTGMRSETYFELNQRLNKAQDATNAIKELLGRDLNVSFAKSYVFIMIGLALVEFNLNKPAFELQFSSLPLVASLLAVAIGLLFMFFIHIIGSEIKSLTVMKEEYGRHVGISASLGLLVLALLYFVALARESLINVNAAASMNLAALINSDTSAALPTSWTLDQSGWFLIIYNLAVLFTGFLIAFFRHDGHPTYEREVLATAKAQKALAMFKSDHLRTCQAIEGKYSEKIGKVEDEMHSSSLRRDQLENEIDHIKSLLTSAKEKIHDETQLRINAFANGVRKVSGPPHDQFPQAAEILDNVIR
jgi:hypothetical protein